MHPWEFYAMYKAELPFCAPPGALLVSYILTLICPICISSYYYLIVLQGAWE